MKWVLIGHRGSGKTSALKRLRSYLAASGARFLDLDEEIERREGRAISQIFQDFGEDQFRKIELDVFNQIYHSTENFVIALGAGFDVTTVPTDVTQIWIRRESDEAGRIFLDRPRLESDVSQLEEFARRFANREPRFARQCDWIFTVPEGLIEETETEKRIFTQNIHFDRAIMTLMPWHIRKWRYWYSFYMQSDLTLEVRTDILNVNEVLMTLSSLPREKILLSHRQLDWPAGQIEVLTDWSLELGPPVIPFHILSKHDLNGQSLEKSLLELDHWARPGVHIKFSPMISNFTELDQLLAWQSEDIQNRSVLPRSLSGRWWWMRCLLKNRQQLNFIREGEGSASDQPTLYQWLSLPQLFNGFAAVLGQPVAHSWTPSFHHSFFAAKKLPVLGIEVPESEYKEAMEFLEKWGLVAAAVTSPLKQKTYKWVDDCSAPAQHLKAVNTIVNVNGTWLGENTDHLALKEILADHINQRVVVWGGGGTLTSIAETLNQAKFYSASKGSPREGQTAEADPEVLIWAAAARASSPENHAATQNWKPKIVLDLNYREDSLAREYAHQVKAIYVSGAEMFRLQGQAQQEYWSRYLS